MRVCHHIVCAAYVADITCELCLIAEMAALAVNISATFFKGKVVHVQHKSPPL